MTDLHTLAEAVTAAEWDHDLTSGRIPPNAARPMTPEERSSGVNFADMAYAEERLAGAVKATLTGLAVPYADWLIAVVRDGRPGPVLDALAVNGPLAAPELLDATRRVVNGVYAALDAAAVEGWCSAYGELPLDGSTADETAMRLLDSLALDQTAWRLATATMTALVADSQRAVAAGADPIDSLLALKLANIGADARAAIIGAHRAGRLLHMQSDLGVLPFADYGSAAMIYASELLDRNTCKACRNVDGRTYRNLADAQADYPRGIYRRCEAGPRCRGTLVIVWSHETDAAPARPKPVDVAERTHRFKNDRAVWTEHRKPGDIKPTMHSATMADHEWLRPNADGFSERRTHKVRVRMIDGRNYEVQEVGKDGYWRTVMIGYWAQVSELASISGILPPGYAWSFSEDMGTYHLYSPDQRRLPKGTHGGGQFTSSLTPITPSGGAGVGNTMAELPADVQAKMSENFTASLEVTPAEAEQNLLDVGLNAMETDPTQALADAQWYFEANAFGAEMARKHGTTEDQALAVTAALSPGTRWENNTIRADQVLADMDPKRPLKLDADLAARVNDHIKHDNDSAMSTYEKKVESFKTGQPWLNSKNEPMDVPKSMPKHPIINTFVAEEGMDVRTMAAFGPGGTRAAALAIGKHNRMGVKSYDPIITAVNVHMNGGEELRGPKVRSFYNNMRFPDGRQDVTIDTWHWRALSVGMDMGPTGDARMSRIDARPSSYTGKPKWRNATVGSYPLAADVTRKATARFNAAQGTDLSVSQYQALIWMHMRRLHPLQDVRDMHAEQAPDEAAFKSYRGNTVKAAAAKARKKGKP